MDAYIKARLSRNTQWRKAWGEYTTAIQELVDLGYLQPEVVVDPSIPLPSSRHHSWEIRHANSAEDLKAQLVALDKASPSRIWFLDDIQEHPTMQWYSPQRAPPAKRIKMNDNEIPDDEYDTDDIKDTNKKPGDQDDEEDDSDASDD
ncbi:unnamed protein product [Phytophthora fragariaefolia]|uniref:Unnamed protein product n=1 Tax=Phytophthora fragariaefolia TaxID=1490495 RepID=A0A9W6YQ74_9STRA|nr:unnamed protein product [Phytophthora fragariaefolia]